MSEEEARNIFSHVVAVSKVLGGDIRQMCVGRGVPDKLINKLLAEMDFWDRGLRKFNWDGSPRKDGD